MTDRPIEPQPGSTLDVADIVGRRGVNASARRELLRGNNLLLNDPRRMGKTVWLDLFHADPGEGLVIVKVDFEGVQTAEQFLVRLVEALRTATSLTARAKARLAAMFEGLDELGVNVGPVKVRAGLSHRTPYDLLGVVTEELDSHLDQGTVLVIAMDEVPAAIGNVTKTEGAVAGELLLQTLRHTRSDNPRLRWILAGSIGFHHVIRGCGATQGVVNDLVTLKLGPLTEPEAEELARRLVAGIGRKSTESGLAALVAVTDGIPFLMHAIAHRLEESPEVRVVDGEAVLTAFDEFVADRDDSRAATHLIDRLDEYYGDDGPLADQVLDVLAVDGPTDAGQVRSRVPDCDDDTFNRVLDALQDDHYIAPETPLAWRYEALRKVWVRRRRLAD